MRITSTTILSIVLHAALIIVLSSGFNFRARAPKKVTTLEAKLMIKDKPRDPELLPRKQAALPPALPAQPDHPKPRLEAPPAKPIISAPAVAVAKVSNTPTKAVPVARPKPAKTSKPKAPTSYAQELARLSESFALELAVNSKEDAVDLSDDGSYFDQIYLLVKKSFVVPAHINGPQGQNLQAVLRLFLSSDGNLARLILEQSSGDDHFDKAVMDGTRRVNNFGAVPIILQRTLSEDGVLVEMCPFKCREQRGG